MKLARSSFSAPFFLVICFAILTSVVNAFALDKGSNGYFHTGDSIRKKSIIIGSVDVYAIGHDMKELPATKSKQAVIDLDTGKRFTWKMLRDVPAEKIQGALREAYAKNGYTDAGKIGQFLGVLNTELTKDRFVTITYDADKKTTTLQVQGGGSASVAGVDFMKATWSIWFGKIDQPSLGDELISKI
jgi:Chalcone isomerase-like